MIEQNALPLNEEPALGKTQFETLAQKFKRVDDLFKKVANKKAPKLDKKKEEKKDKKENEETTEDSEGKKGKDDL
jgi:hypothetical protein